MTDRADYGNTAVLDLLEARPPDHAGDEGVGSGISDFPFSNFIKHILHS